METLSTTPRTSESTFDLPQGQAGQQLFQELCQRHELHEGSRHSHDTVYLDTFDGRLFARSRALRSAGGMLHLERLDRPGRQVRLEFDGLPAFADELPPGGLRDELLALAGNRALLRLFAVRSEVRTWSRRNRDQKTTLRVSLSEEEASDGKRTVPLPPLVTVRQVRGYKKVFREVCAWWAERDVHAAAASRYQRAMDALGLDPLQAAAAARVKLDPSMTAADAVRSMIRAQYQVVRGNEEGILVDADTEFLHSFRVAVRRARSFLGQLRDVFAPAPGAGLRKSLAWLGKSTNALRDLDVYLLQQADYRGLLTGGLADDLAPLFDFAARERAAAHGVLVGVLGSSGYDQAVQRWRACVEDPAVLGLGARGSEPVLSLVGARAAKKCRAVLEQGSGLQGRAEDAAAFHALRIECKQLRYLLEVLADLEPQAGGVVPHLKKLQDALGRIQDLTVHEARTREFAQALWVAGDRRTRPAAEVLVSRMRVEQELACARVPELLARFTQSLRATEPPYLLLLPWLRRLEAG